MKNHCPLPKSRGTSKMNWSNGAYHSISLNMRFVLGPLFREPHLQPFRSIGQGCKTHTNEQTDFIKLAKHIQNTCDACSNVHAVHNASAHLGVDVRVATC